MADAAAPRLERALLEVRDLAVAYGSRPALAGVDFELPRASVVGLLGPNGAGKSTLVRALSGVAGFRRQRDGPRRRPASPAAQGARAAHRGGAAGAAFRLPVHCARGRGHGSPSAPRRISAFESAHDLAIARQALERCGALHLAQRPIDQLSSGERQRIVFARALAQQAPILLLDEPASFLDLRFQVELFDRVRELADGGTGVVAVLHDLNLAAEYCDRDRAPAGRPGGRRRADRRGAHLQEPDARSTRPRSTSTSTTSPAASWSRRCRPGRAAA